LILALLSIPFSYFFPSGESSYEFKATLDGYLPLMGGMTTKAEVKMRLSIRPSEAPTERDYRLLFSVKSFDVGLLEKGSGEIRPLPIGLENAKAYFPDAWITVSPLGRISKSDAPDKKLPVRLPGLDAKHLPDMTVLLLEFPDGGVEQDKPFKYSRKFGDSEPQFEATYRGKDEIGEKFELRMKQNYVAWEDPNHNEVGESENPAARVETRVEGHGFVWFDKPGGRILRGSLTAESMSAVVSLKGEPTKARALKTSVEILSKRST
jgi:hypothetical protein